MKYLIGVLSILMSLSVFGQTHSLGVKSGLSMTNVSSSDFLDTKFNPGFTGGLAYDLEFENGFHLGIDILSAQKGFGLIIQFTNETGLNNPRIDSEWVFKYIAFPMKAGLSVGDSKFSGIFYAGLVPSFLTLTEVRIPSFDGIAAQRLDQREVVENFDIGGLLEAGLYCKINEKFSLLGVLDFQHSFSKTAGSAFASARHYGMTFSVGAKYKLGS